MYTFWLDSTPTDEREPQLALHAATYREHAWNGFHVPLVTASEYIRFIGAWRANDPNGEWDTAGIREGDGALIHEWADTRDVFTVAAMTDDGHPLYAIDGWTWAELDNVA